jgi:hypothetical protein
VDVPEDVQARAEGGAEARGEGGAP